MFLLSLKEKCFVLASLVQLYLSTIRRILLMSKAFCRNRHNSEKEFQLIVFKGTGKDGSGGLKSGEADQGRCDVLESQHKVRRGYHPGACPLITSLQLLSLSSLTSPLQEWYKGFISDCPNGKLTPPAFVKIYSQCFPSGNARDFCDHIFRTFDTDGNGYIDFREFLLAIDITSSGTAEEKLGWAFR